MNKLHNVKTIFILSVKMYVLLRHRILKIIILNRVHIQ